MIALKKLAFLAAAVGIALAMVEAWRWIERVAVVMRGTP